MHLGAERFDKNKRGPVLYGRIDIYIGRTLKKINTCLLEFQLVHQCSGRPDVACLKQAVQLGIARMTKLVVGFLKLLKRSIVGLHSRCPHLLLHNSSRFVCIALKHQPIDQLVERDDGWHLARVSSRRHSAPVVVNL